MFVSFLTNILLIYCFADHPFLARFGKITFSDDFTIISRQSAAIQADF